MGNFTDFFTVASSNNLIESISGICDGRTIEGISSSYTLENVTGGQTTTDSYADITGSSIAYTPPTGTKYIHYEYIFKFDPTVRSGISGFRLYVDNSQVTAAYRQLSSNHGLSASYAYGEFQGRMDFVFDLTASSDDIPNGKFSNWTTARTIKTKARRYNSGYTSSLNTNLWMDGGGASGSGLWTPPLLTVTAYS
tara:strand:- start:288 stop:872 length:585 start_codon:yes stop_codon:yes gene_type:complete